MTFWQHRAKAPDAAAGEASGSGYPHDLTFVTDEVEPARVAHAFLEHVAACVTGVGNAVMVTPAKGVKAMRVLASLGPSTPPAGSLYPAERGVLARALRSGGGARLSGADPAKAPFEALLGEVAVASPLHDGDKVVAAVGVFGDSGPLDGPVERALADLIAHARGVLLGALRLSVARDELATQRSLVDLAARLMGTIDREELLSVVLECALALVGAQTGSIMLLDRDADRLRIAKSVGLPEDVAVAAAPRVGEGISGFVARAGKGMVIEDIGEPHIGKHAAPEVTSSVCVPMLAPDGELIGVINVGGIRPDAGSTDVAVVSLTRLAELAALAIRSADRASGTSEPGPAAQQGTADTARDASPGAGVAARPATPKGGPPDARLGAVLFDLDGTLLDVDIDTFWRAYFHSLASAFADLMDPERFIAILKESTTEMMRNTGPQRTNRDAFWEDFLPKIGVEYAVLEPRIEYFYEVDFAKLAGYAERVPLARDAVTAALGLGVPVAIATNPIFPRRAVEHRLDWAGVGDLPFALVTTYEFMHSTKPHREYFEEVAALLGVEPPRCLMVGNDEEDDMAAAELGMTCYLVEDHAMGRDNGRAIRLRGSMADLLEYLRTLARS